MANATPGHVPAPWTCKCETYWLLLTLRSPLSPAIYAPLEAIHAPIASNNAFKGGLGMIQIVRYLDTPVGPYDELLVIPGNFQTPCEIQKGKPRLRIPRIYVSEREAMYNGRRNWNIPKRLANFKFSAPAVKKDESPPKELSVSVYPFESNEDGQPFFSATLTPSRWLPAVPFSTNWLPLNTYLVQPPLPAGSDKVTCGTDEWRGFEVTVHAKRARLAWAQMQQQETQDGQGNYWPTLKPWKLALWLEDATLEIPVPDGFET